LSPHPIFKFFVQFSLETLSLELTTNQNQLILFVILAQGIEGSQRQHTLKYKAAAVTLGGQLVRNQGQGWSKREKERKPRRSKFQIRQTRNHPSSMERKGMLGRCGG